MIKNFKDFINEDYSLEQQNIINLFKSGNKESIDLGFVLGKNFKMGEFWEDVYNLNNFLRGNSYKKNRYKALEILTSNQNLEIVKAHTKNIKIGDLNWDLLKDSKILQLSITYSELTSSDLSKMNLGKNFKHLIYLNLNHNKLTKLPTFPQSMYIKHLHLNNNFIENLDELTNLNKLESLYVRGNKIKDLQPLESLVNLKILNLNNNPLDPKSFKYLQNLKDLEFLNIDFVDNLDKVEIDVIKNITNNDKLFFSIDFPYRATWVNNSTSAKIWKLK